MGGTSTRPTRQDLGLLPGEAARRRDRPRPLHHPVLRQRRLFADYAEKVRGVWSRPAPRRSTTPPMPFSFPEGTIITKSFGFADDLRKANPIVDWVETRLLINTDGGWFPYRTSGTTAAATRRSPKRGRAPGQWMIWTAAPWRTNGHPFHFPVRAVPPRQRQRDPHRSEARQVIRPTPTRMEGRNSGAIGPTSASSLQRPIRAPRRSSSPGTGRCGDCG